MLVTDVELLRMRELPVLISDHQVLNAPTTIIVAAKCVHAD
jgi:hypothetical protein